MTQSGNARVGLQERLQHEPSDGHMMSVMLWLAWKPARNLAVVCRAERNAVAIQQQPCWRNPDTPALDSSCDPHATTLNGW